MTTSPTGQTDAERLEALHASKRWFGEQPPTNRPNGFFVPWEEWCWLIALASRAVEAEKDNARLQELIDVRRKYVREMQENGN